MSTDIYFNIVPVEAVFDDFVYWKQNPKNPREEYIIDTLEEFGPNRWEENHCLVEMGWHAQERARKTNPEIPEYDGICRILPEDLDFLEQKVKAGLNLKENESSTKYATKKLTKFISAARRHILPWTQERIDAEVEDIEKQITRVKTMQDLWPNKNKESVSQWMSQWMQEAERLLKEVRSHEIDKIDFALYMEQY